MRFNLKLIYCILSLFLISSSATAITITSNSIKTKIIGDCQLLTAALTSSTQLFFQISNINTFDDPVGAIRLQTISGVERDLTSIFYADMDGFQNTAWNSNNIENLCGYEAGSVTDVQSDYIFNKTLSEYTDFSASFTYNSITYTMYASASGVTNISTSTPITVADAPTSLVATAGDGQVSVAFTAPTDNGGSAITDYDYQLDGGSWVSASTTSSPIVITGLTNGTSYSIKLRAVNAAGDGTASIAVQVTTLSPQSAFDAVKDEVVSQVQVVALQNLRNSVQETTDFMFSARDRFIASRLIDQTSVLSSRNSVPFDIEGSTSVSTSSANIDGSFFGQFGDFDGTYRRITSGDFNLQRYEGGNTTAALSGRIAWEYLTSDTAMLGWFVGAEYVQSDLNGTFTGDQTSFGASIGGYFVSELQDRLFLDGHLTLKQNEHDLMLSNGMLDLESIYHSTTVLTGLTLTGVSTIDESSELWPTLSINAAQSDLGAIGFTGTAYGLTNSTLSMDGGLVSYADVSLAPKYRAAMDGQTLANSLLVATVTPKAMCEYTELSSTTSRNCGTGLLLGLLGTTKDGNGTLELELGLDSIGGTTRHSVALNADLRY